MQEPCLHFIESGVNLRYSPSRGYRPYGLVYGSLPRFVISGSSIMVCKSFASLAFDWIYCSLMVMNNLMAHKEDHSSSWFKKKKIPMYWSLYQITALVVDISTCGKLKEVERTIVGQFFCLDLEYSKYVSKVSYTFFLWSIRQCYQPKMHSLTSYLWKFSNVASFSWQCSSWYIHLILDMYWLL